uniref:Uncharacterized protein n=1 Tax=Micrurus surinamensis TaxID=129470 RepID=A0A2D4PD82_MICSU
MDYMQSSKVQKLLSSIICRFELYCSVPQPFWVVSLTLGGGRGEGQVCICAHAELHLCEQQAGVGTAHASGAVSTSAYRTCERRGSPLLSQVGLRVPATHTAQLQISHSSVVGHNPQVGDPRTIE